ncbi:alpha/beta hydrolase [Amaricoccus sp.]|uniref:alpha/beta fold hydrolase n=1 Tax=Amaricoccus sp. TaxID=1872485 RepID=UPI001B64E9E7|nr:alpha/beta hydrolase [Amaricoccus sp.]MBP7000067.1 alpha/beta fold hydrolase [Amaricoccus sp.]
MRERVQPDGRRLGWREAGQGAPALFLHCMLGRSAAWTGVIAELGDRLAISAPDLPGHGRTEHDPARSVQEQALADARSLLGGAGRTHVVGHSFGGAVALRLAVEAPEAVASLTLIEPVLFALLAGGDPAAHAAEAAAAAPARARMAAGDWPGAAEAFLARWSAVPLGGLSPERAAEMIAGMPLVAAGEADIVEPATARPRADEIAAIAAPVLLIDGACSPPSIAAILDRLAALLPAARRVTVPGAGHMLPITHAGAVSGALRDFLAAGGGDRVG